jgi:tetratricopeptide (TPR) repeat protein
MAGKYIHDTLGTLPVKMGAEDDMQNGLHLYNKGQFTSAIQKFESILQKDSSNYSAQRLAGIAYLRLGNYNKALDYFQQLEKYTSNYSNEGKFLRALTLMKRNQTGDKRQARQLLQEVVDNDLEGKEASQQWLDKKW